MFTQLLSQEVKELSPEDTYHLASNINTSASNLFNLLENLLQWSKYQMMGIKPQIEEFNLTELVNRNIFEVATLVKKDVCVVGNLGFCNVI